MFSKTESETVAELVRAIEGRTSGEVAVVWSPRSGAYAEVRGLWALLLAAVLAGEVAAWGPPLAAPWWPPIVAASTLALYFAFGWGPVLRLLVPDAALAERVHRRAAAAFLEFGVTETQGRSGVLLFLSALEHRVEILADQGIAARVDPALWQSIVDELIVALRSGKTMPGLVRALERIGDHLGQEFPRSEGDENELDDAPRAFR